jgi:2-(1,2-epoxy-1,2-dihydrophenyl)acetyl-CoA isomerase
MEYQDIIVQKDGAVGVVTLNRPEVLNAFRPQMRDEISHAFESFQHDDTIRAAVITGAGRGFCAGGDMKIMNEVKTHEFREMIMGQARRAVTAITSLEKPVIAMVNGPAGGGGCNLALACDIIIASEKAFFTEAFIKIGLVPDWAGAFFLTRMVGIHRAKEMAFTGDRVSATEAERIGLINRVVPPEALEETTMSLAKRLANSPTKAIGVIKKMMYKAWLMDLDSLLEYEGLVQPQLMNSHDHEEGVKAFLEKREPKFTGK